MTHQELLRDVEHLASSAPDVETLMQRVADHVHATLLRYNGVSFRLVDEAEPGVLVLGPYRANVLRSVPGNSRSPASHSKQNA